MRRIDGVAILRCNAAVPLAGHSSHEPNADSSEAARAKRRQ
jgi:hypothetical protein